MDSDHCFNLTQIPEPNNIAPMLIRILKRLKVNYETAKWGDFFMVPGRILVSSLISTRYSMWVSNIQHLTHTEYCFCTRSKTDSRFNIILKIYYIVELLKLFLSITFSLNVLFSHYYIYEPGYNDIGGILAWILPTLKLIE